MIYSKFKSAFLGIFIDGNKSFNNPLKIPISTYAIFG